MFDKREFADLPQALPTSGSRQRFVSGFLMASVIVLGLSLTGANRRALAQDNQDVNPCAELKGLKNANLTALQGQQDNQDVNPCTESRGLKNANLTALQGQAASLHIRESDPNLRLSQDAQGRKLTIGINNATATEYQIVIDDSASFQQPILSRRVTGSNATLDVLESGLSPGVPYYLSITPGALRAQFSLRQPLAASDLPANYLKNAWHNEGRRWVAKYTGVHWIAAKGSAKGSWEINPKWPDAKSNVAPQAYYAPYALRGAVNQALVNHDLQLMDELAQFYLVYLQRFTTLGEMRRQKSAHISTDPLLNQGVDSSRTLEWLAGKEKKIMQESVTSTAQFLHPTARLIRIITTLPPDKQSPQMKKFVAAYYPLILRDQVLRLAYVAHWNYKANDLPWKLIDIWKAILQSSSRPTPSYQHAMFDRDLWLIAIAAELLGANANAPQLAPLAAHESAQLREITSIGVQLFQKKRTLYADTRNFAGQVVQSASYFNGDMEDHPDMAYAGYEGKNFPDQKDKAPGVSWDISHFQRVPIFLRALYDNRKATRLSFPQAHDIQLVANQFVYKVFYGDFRRPLFSNYFDGGDGWYRVCYQGRDSASPPSCGCNPPITEAKLNSRPCLTLGGIQGWSQVSFFNNDLLKLQRALTLLAASNDAEAIKFRNRYYTYNKQDFAFTNSKGEAYPILLYAVLAELPE
ncbi:MAG TPA: hypothetical protein VGB77_20315 [Abditibacteriaceae bacterium]|jgi:hypothetical protein